MDVDIAVKAPSIAAMENLEYEVIGEMRKIRQLRPTEGDNFSINKLDSLMGAFNNIVGAVLGIGLLVTSIALFVGGIGVMNIMFVSVTERTREIGTMKCIGALDQHIVMLFLVEAVIQGTAGGLIGYIIGVVAALASTGFTTGFDIIFKVGTLDLLAYMMGTTLLSIVLSIVASMYPAWRASKLPPVEALRYEL